MNAQDKSRYFIFGEPYKATAIVMPHESPDSITANILFRISYETLQFRKVKLKGQESYTAYTDVKIDFTDTTGVVRGRTQWKDTIVTYDYAETIDKNLWVEGAYTVNLPKIDYTASLEFDNRSKYRNNEIDLLIKGNSGFEFEDGDFSVMYSYRLGSEGIYDPMIARNTILFNSEGALINIVSQSSNPKSAYRYICREIDSSVSIDYEDDNTANLDVYFSGAPAIIENKIPSLRRYRDELSLSNSTLDAGEKTTLNFEIVLPPNKLKPGSYEMLLFDELGTDTLSMEFAVIWEDMPQSLTDIEGAIEYMYYILSDEEYERMLDLPPKERAKAFDAYWERIDPSPTTPFNEAEFQYFCRVDYAYFNYKTLVQRDGAKTDRGKIYILYGKPDRIDETFDDDDDSLIKWRYNKLNKEFEFKAVSTGIYKLIAINEI